MHIIKVSETQYDILIETFTSWFSVLSDFLIAVGEPVFRTNNIHRYKITPYTLYTSISIGLTEHKILVTLEKHYGRPLPEDLRNFVHIHSKAMGKVRIIVKNRNFYLVSRKRSRLVFLLEKSLHLRTCVQTPPRPILDPLRDLGSHLDPWLENSSDSDEGEERDTTRQQIPQNQNPPQTHTHTHLHAFITRWPIDPYSDQIAWCCLLYPDTTKLVLAKRICVQFQMPPLEEYDYIHDEITPFLDIDLKPTTHIRPYQEQALFKMFNSGRAKSGILVLPCGAGKTLLGITACTTIHKNTLVICTSTTAVKQWKHQFEFWTNVNSKLKDQHFHQRLSAEWLQKHPHQDKNVKKILYRRKLNPPRYHRISLFTAGTKSPLCPFHDVTHEHYDPEYWQTCPGHIIITTYSMMIKCASSANPGTRNYYNSIVNHTWGLLILDEVHRSPADHFQTVLTTVPAQCRLGLTATLVREDDRIESLKYLVGPKLFEADWKELQLKGYLANVGCFEIWCEMDPIFYAAYLHASSDRLRKTLAWLNPKKFLLVGHLLAYHESRGDKIIVFADDVFTLRQYAALLGKTDFVISGKTPQKVRDTIIAQFRSLSGTKVLFLSKVGDDSIDLPDANCLIQISSHGGSRRQEAQRLGRILRPKQPLLSELDDPFELDEGLKETISNIRPQETNNNFDSFFYTVVSQDTHEVPHSNKRRTFLSNQGYSFFIRTNEQLLAFLNKELGPRFKKVLSLVNGPNGTGTSSTSSQSVHGLVIKQRLSRLNPFHRMLWRLIRFCRPTFPLELLNVIRTEKAGTASLLEKLKTLSGVVEKDMVIQRKQLHQYEISQGKIDTLAGGNVALLSYSDKT